MNPRRKRMDNFIEMARSHRKKYLPKLYNKLEQEGRLEEHLASVARMAEEELLELVSDQGMRQSEAMEVVLPKYILISPEMGRGFGGLRSGHTDDRGNYRINVDDKIGEGGKVEKYECNVAAIRLLKRLETEGRYATPEEQAVLVKYTGWGGLSEAFKESNEGKWKERSEELKDLLGESEYRSASRSTINAHYTDPEIARRVWKAALRLGYSGGPTLEPAAGVGHFFGVRPLGVPIEMHGIEMDSISGRIAQHLYQSADIRIMPYENVRMEENRYNLIISNVPFSDVKPYEDSKTRTPGLDGRYALHDFYFLKSLYGTRPGGIVAFITSRYTLDKESKEVREKIAESADFVGAIRLPNDTFKGIANTEVVTDIVFLQKRSHGPGALGVDAEVLGHRRDRA